MKNLPQNFIEEAKDIIPSFDDYLASLDRQPTKAFKANERFESRLLEAMGGRESVPFAPHCYYLGDEKWGTHKFHHAGLMYIQEPSAMAPVNAFDIKASLALDLCAAPGGKSVQLCGKVDMLVSNEINPSRAAVLRSNIERMGAKNVAVTNHSPKDFEPLGELFDLVLVDAPCSGEGMFRKEEDAIRDWSVENSISCALRQYSILCSADKVLKNGGLLIYSTCTFSRREDEDVVEKFLSEHDYELISPSAEAIAHSTYLTNPKMRRIYPHLERGEGQFFAGLIKRGGTSDAEATRDAARADSGRTDRETRGEARKKPIKYSSDGEVRAFLLETIGERKFCCYGDSFFLPALDFSLPLQRVCCGVKIGKKQGKNFKPDHAFFSAYGDELFTIEPSDDEVYKYLHGEELSGEHRGYGAVTVLGAPLGGFKGSEGRYKNLYPKGLRI